MPRSQRHPGRAGLALALIVFPSIGAAGAASAAIPDDSLATTTAAPWNPPHALAARRPWERALDFPGRVVSLPFVVVGAGVHRTLEWIEDRHLVALRPITAPPDGSVRPVRQVTFNAPHLGDRAGVGGGVILRTPATTARAPALSVRYAATVHDYNSTAVTASRGPFSLQYGYDWRPQMQFFGLGPGSSDAVATDYAAQDEFVRAAATFTLPRDSSHAQPPSPPVELRVWAGPRAEVMRRGREIGRASYETVFPDLGAATLDRRVENFVWGGGVTLDSRAGTPHWSRGGRVRVDVERMDEPIHALALHAAGGDMPSATRLVADAEGGISFFRDPRTLRLRVRVADLTLDRHPERFLISDLSRLGGREGLAGFTPGRFVDRDALLGKAMYVFPLSRLFEMDLHGEWGAVYHDVWRDATFGSLEHSYGFAFRGRSDTGPHGSIGLDFSREGARINYAWGGVE